ncbi:MAG: translocation/assembly module TamB domain-containing protein [bacterium]
MTIRKTHRFRRFIGVMALLFGFLAGASWLVNRPEVLAHALAVANAAGRLRIEVGSFQWKPIRGEISLTSLSLADKMSGRRAIIGNVTLEYALLGLARGKLVIDELRLNDVMIDLPASPEQKTKPAKKRFNTAKLLLLKHIELIDASASGVNVNIGDDKRLMLDEVHAALVPSMLGDARFAARADGVKLDKGEKQLFSAGFASLKTSTRLERWQRRFPYVNAFSGNVSVRDIVTTAIAAEELDAEISFDDDRIELSDLSLLIEGRELKGKLNSDIETQDFALDIDIPKPVSLPYLGKESQIFDTAGELSGSVKLAGKGYKPLESEGAGSASLTYRFKASPDQPVSVNSNLTWKDGSIRFSSGSATAGSDVVAFSGSIDVGAKSMDLEASGSNFPVEHLFTKFSNPHLKKIFGRSDCEVKLTGWGKQVHVEIRGETFEGGWIPIMADRVLTELDITYDELVMHNDVFTAERMTGSSDLTVKFGEKMADGKRRKHIDLSSEMHDMPLDRSMEAFGLKGVGNGAIELTGPHTDFTGKARASITNGSWHEIPFERAAATVDITRRRLEFLDIEAGLHGEQVRKIEGALAAELSPGRMRLHGEPIKGLLIDGTYAYDPHTWSFAELSWTGSGGERLGAKGRLTSGGPIDLSVDGTVDVSALSLLTPSLYRGSGLLGVDLSVRGTTNDPRFFGSIEFKDNNVLLRNPRVGLESVTGALRFDGSRVRFDSLQAKMGDGSMSLSGYLDHQNFKPAQSDLALAARGMVWRSEDGYLMLEFEGDISLTGRFPNPLLSGDMTVLDGKYTKDFNIIDALTGEKKMRSRKEVQKLDFDPRLALSVRNSGDMEIRNNVGDIWLGMNISLSGTRSKPVVAGSINADSGELHYLGLNFDVSKGFMEFRGDVDSPYLEVYAEKEIDVYSVNLILHGPIDNLALDLTATSPTGPLEKRDVVSLILFGMTEQERIAIQSEGLSAAMVAQSITSVIERPIAKFTRLDVFRFEVPDTAAQGISRLNVGKKLSDRLSVSFATDIGTDNAVQTFSAEYQITDNLLLKGSNSTDSNYELSGILRFRMR